MASQESFLDQGMMQGGSKASPELGGKSRAKLIFEPLASDINGDRINTSNRHIEVARAPEKSSSKPAQKSKSQERHIAMISGRDSNTIDVRL